MMIFGRKLYNAVNPKFTVLTSSRSKTLYESRLYQNISLIMPISKRSSVESGTG